MLIFIQTGQDLELIKTLRQNICYQALSDDAMGRRLGCESGEENFHVCLRAFNFYTNPLEVLRTKPLRCNCMAKTIYPWPETHPLNCTAYLETY